MNFQVWEMAMRYHHALLYHVDVHNSLRIPNNHPLTPPIPKHMEAPNYMFWSRYDRPAHISSPLGRI
jgi:hypothetical protein